MKNEVNRTVEDEKIRVVCSRYDLRGAEPLFGPCRGSVERALYGGELSDVKLAERIVSLEEEYTARRIPSGAIELILQADRHELARRRGEVAMPGAEIVPVQ